MGHLAQQFPLLAFHLQFEEPTNGLRRIHHRFRRRRSRRRHSPVRLLRTLDHLARLTFNPRHRRHPLPEEHIDHRRRAEQSLNSARRRLSLRDDKSAAIHAAAAQAHANIYLAATIAAIGRIAAALPESDPERPETGHAGQGCSMMSEP